MEGVGEQLNARVYGRVQGVGFRVFVRDTAQRLALGGWVRNGHDGSVLVQAVGPRAALEALLTALQRGPSMARVDRVVALWTTATSAADPFEVRG
ncbi:MAG: acylphosphatase [Chloroflexota bacterium]|nr:acylphosphatase [Chloroflexota bacterium]